MSDRFSRWTCALCGAAPGGSCVTKSGRVSPYHKSRFHQAVAAEAAEAPEDRDESYKDEGNRFVNITLSPTTLHLLEDLAKTGIYGIGVEGVIEGFVYRGLQRERS